MPKRPDKQPIAELALRMPIDVKQWIEERARKTLGSQNNEIVRILRERMVDEQRVAG